jgi:hypothetical protein
MDSDVARVLAMRGRSEPRTDGLDPSGQVGAGRLAGRESAAGVGLEGLEFPDDLGPGSPGEDAADASIAVGMRDGQGRPPSAAGGAIDAPLALGASRMRGWHER